MTGMRQPHLEISIGNGRQLGPGDIHQHPRIGLTELVDQHGPRQISRRLWCVRLAIFSEKDMSFGRHRQGRILEHERDKVGSDHRCDLWWQDYAPELGRRAIDDQDEVCWESDALRGWLSRGRRLFFVDSLVRGRYRDTDNVVRVLVRHEMVDSRFDKGDVGTRGSFASESHDEASKVEGAAVVPSFVLWLPLIRQTRFSKRQVGHVGSSGRVSNVDMLVAPEDRVAFTEPAVDAIETLEHAEFVQGGTSTGLEQFANDAIGKRKVALDEEDLAPRGTESVSEGRADGT